MRPYPNLKRDLGRDAQRPGALLTQTAMELAFHSLTEVLRLIGQTLNRVGCPFRVLRCRHRTIRGELRAPGRILREIRLFNAHILLLLPPRPMTYQQV